MTPARHRPTRGRRVRGVAGVRGLGAGLVAALGALIAHVTGGGEVEVVPGLAVAACALPLGLLLVGRDGARPQALSPPRLVLVAAAAQAVAHGSLMLAPTAGAGHEHHGAGGALAGAAGLGPAMVAHHLLVALATVAVGAGLDRALVSLARAVLAAVLPRGPRAVSLPALRRLAAIGVARVLRPRALDAGARPRAPPRAMLLPVLPTQTLRRVPGIAPLR
ncbi:hypothetical protein [Nocardioides sp.]|uniref:hypothetical protein n=1 Tax=Nocardioides sp. TaxID=35761 RepID=UPI003514C0CD